MPVILPELLFDFGGGRGGSALLKASPIKYRHVGAGVGMCMLMLRILVGGRGNRHRCRVESAGRR